jgi:DNA gyrase subunit A
MELGKIFRREITEEMREAYLDYAMSVIVSRALPDVRDGLKPVQRRILYAMYELGLGPASKFRKSALVIGDVLGKYHPHGDVAVYEALVRMAQPFSLRYPLIQGQGNFGSIDGDPPAAMRYTEAKLSPIAQEMLRDIDKETVEFVPNYDASRNEPKVLPAMLPNILINGSMGIAVGMATSIPPHNLSEVVDAIKYFISHPDANTEELCEFIKGPDFPTGGIIFDKKAIIEAYSTGRGPITVRARMDIEERQRGQSAIVITEIPYEVNKSELIEHIVNLAEEKKIEGIRAVRDESDKEGMRIVIELRSDAFPERVISQLYKMTDLEKAYHLNMLALVDGIQPEVLSLPAIISHYIRHRQEVVRRRTEFELNRTKERIHILEGLIRAIEHIDEIINLIKKSENRQDAKMKLINRYKLSDIQAEAILEMKLSQLAKLERVQLQSELEQKKKIAEELSAILKDPKKLNNVIVQELEELKKNYGDKRKTEVIPEPPTRDLKEDIFVPAEEIMVTLSVSGYIKRMKPSTVRVQKRGGKGVIGFEAKTQEDALKLVTVCNSQDILFLFTNLGRVFRLDAHNIPEASRNSAGKLIKQFLNLSPEETINSIVNVPRSIEETEKYFIIGTKNGIMKRLNFKELKNTGRRPVTVLKVKKGDSLIWAGISDGGGEIFAVSSLGQVIRFSETELRPMGRVSQGVKGMRLENGDSLVGMGIFKASKKNEGSDAGRLLIVTKNGYGKQTPVGEYRIQRRGGSGVKTAKINEKTGEIVGALLVDDTKSEVIAASLKGQTIRLSLDSIKILGRAAQGVKIMRLDQGDFVASITVW